MRSSTQVGHTAQDTANRRVGNCRHDELGCSQVPAKVAGVRSSGERPQARRSQPTHPVNNFQCGDTSRCSLCAALVIRVACIQLPSGTTNSGWMQPGVCECRAVMHVGPCRHIRSEGLDDTPYERATVKPRRSVALAKESKSDLAAQSPAHKSIKGEAATRSVGSPRSTFSTDLRVELQRLPHRIGLASSLRTSVRKGQLQQGASQQTTSGACKPGSDPSLATWTFWAAAAAQKPQWASHPRVTTQPCCLRSAVRQATPIRATVSPEKPVKQGRTSLLAFVAAPRPAASQRHKRKMSDEISRAPAAGYMQRNSGGRFLYRIERAHQV